MVSMASNNEHEFPRSGRLAGVDYGTVRTGISVCDPDRILVSPLEILQRGTPEEDAAYFRRTARRERLAGFVVGLPIHFDGGESEKSREARKFARWLAEATGLPVRLFDERFTTSAATEKLRASGMKSKRRKKRLDAVAAQVLLEAFLEAERYGKRTPGEDPLAEGEAPGPDAEGLADD